MERKSFKSSFGNISYIEREGDVPIIFLHGLGGTGNSWLKMGGLIDNRFGLYMLDLLGHGRSSKPDLDYTFTVQEEVLGEFVEHIGSDNFSFVGNSLGGWISLRYAVDKTAPSNIILEDSAGLNKTFGELDEAHREEVAAALANGKNMNSASVIKSIMKNNADQKWKMKRSELKEVRSRTLIIWGSEDGIIPLSYGRTLNELIPGSRFVEIRGASHVPHVSHSEIVAKTINDFLISR